MESLNSFVGAVAFSLILIALHTRSSRRPQRLLSDTSARLLAQGQRKVVTKLLDIGGFFGVDIGGTLTKLVFFAPDKDLVGRMLRRVSPAHAAEAGWHSKLSSIQQLEKFILSRTIYGGTGVRDAHLSFHMAELGGSFHFIRFETRRMEGALRMAARARLHVGMHTILATGGGAMKFADAAASMLGIHLEACDEIDCLVKGMAFLMAHIVAEAYTFKGSSLEDRPFSDGIQYPYLLVNIGSGVGFILVTSETSWTRVAGTSLGGGTFYGLVRSLTGMASFDEMLDLAEVGDNSAVDLTVGDIYGGDYSRFGLKSSTIAASFGKAVTWPHAQPGRVRSGTASDADDADADNAGERDGSFRTIGGPGVRRSNAQKLPSPDKLRRVRSSRGYAPRERDGYATPLVSRNTSMADLSGVAVDAELAESNNTRNREGETSGDRISAQVPRIDVGLSLAEAALPPDSTANPSVPTTPVNGNTSREKSEFSNSRETVDSGVESTPLQAASADGTPHGPQPVPKLNESDVSRSLLIMLSNNIGQLAFLNALRHKCKNVFFAGNFLRHENTIAMRTLAYAIQFWSKGSMEGLFLRHEGYCGSLGAFLNTLESADEQQDQNPAGL